MTKQLEFVIFWIAMLALMIVSLYHNKFSRKGQKYIVFLFFVVFTLMFSYRTLGLDLVNYETYYKNVNISALHKLDIKNMLSNEYEPFFTLIVLLAKKYQLTFNQWLLIVVSIPSLLFFFYITKKSRFPLITYMLFMLVMMFQFDLIRLMLAFPFLMIAFNSHNKCTKAICYGVAFGFHYTSIVLLLCEIAMKVKWKRKGLLILFAAIIGVGCFIKFSDLTFLQNSEFRILFKLQLYLNTTAREFDGNIVFYLLFIAINLYPTCMSYFLLKKMQNIGMEGLLGDAEDNKKIIDTMKVGVFACIMIALLFSSPQMVFRIQILTYFMVFMPLTEPIRKGIQSGTVSRNAFAILASLFMYNIFMTMYYVTMSIVY